MQDWFNFQKAINVIHLINKLNNNNKKTHLIISVDAGKASDKIQYLLMVKTMCR